MDRWKCDDCAWYMVLPQDDGIDAGECCNPESERWKDWVSGSVACDAFNLVDGEGES